MAGPRSPQLRERIVNSISQGMSISEAVETYQVARRTIYYYLERVRSPTKTPRAVRGRRGPKSKLEKYREAIISARNANPDLSIRELCELLKLPVSRSALSRAIVAWTVRADQAIDENPRTEE